MYLILVIIAALAALGFAAYNFFFVKKLDEGTSAMKEIAAAIREGANAFINYEYKSPLSGRGRGRRSSWPWSRAGESAVALVIGSVMSGCARALWACASPPTPTSASPTRRARHPQIGKDVAGRLPRRQRHGPVRGGLCPAGPFHRLSDLRLRHGPAQRGELRLHHELDGRLLCALHHDHVRLRAGLLHRGHVQPRGRRHLHQGGGHGR